MQSVFKNIIPEKARVSSRLLVSSALFLALLSVAMPTAVSAQEQAYSLSSGSPTEAPSQPQQAPAYTPEQLDQLLAPIALYPDSLVGQILMASTYPLEVVEAYRWQQQPAIAGLQGNQLQAALDQLPWDPSVKSLVAFPQLLKTLNDNLQWMEQLGDAFLAQQADVTNEIQQLRQRAEAAGTLQSTPQQVVSSQDGDIIIAPANPEMVYVPAYNPLDVYGAWPYADYQPYYFPGYTYAGVALTFGYGIAVADWFWGWDHWDWRNHRIDIDDRRFSQLNRGFPSRGDGAWRYDPAHRHGVPYQSAPVRAQFQSNRAPGVTRSYRGYAAAPQTPRNEPEHNAYFNHSAHPQPNMRQVGPVPVNRPAGAPQIRLAPGQNIDRQPDNTRRVAPEVVNRPATAPQIQRAPEQNFARFAPVEVPRPAPAPVFESFSRGGASVHVESARGAYSRASAAAPAPAFRGGSAPAPRPVGGGNRGGQNLRHQ